VLYSSAAPIASLDIIPGDIFEVHACRQHSHHAKKTQYSQYFAGVVIYCYYYLGVTSIMMLSAGLGYHLFEEASLGLGEHECGEHFQGALGSVQFKGQPSGFKNNGNIWRDLG
jgi:hypothetical protein